MEKTELERFGLLLKARRSELESLRAGSAGARAPVELDQQSVGRVSRVDALQQQAMAKAQEHKRAIDVARLDQALRRVETGDYGYCLDCGEDIALKRLEIDPACTLCISCADR